MITIADSYKYFKFLLNRESLFVALLFWSYHKFNDYSMKYLAILENEKKQLVTYKAITSDLVKYFNTFEESDQRYFETMCEAFKQATGHTSCE